MSTPPAFGSFFSSSLPRVAALALAFVAGPGRAADESSPATPEVPIHGIFDTELPRTEWRRHLRVIFHPHFGDFTRHDYLRVPLGFRYGLTEHWEASAELESYLAHGLGAVPFGHGGGLGSVRLATKYHWTEWLRPFFDTAAGISYAAPLETPPADVSDRLFHVTPYITFAHTPAANPDLSLFLSLGYDDVTASRSPATPQRNGFIDDSWSITPGFVWNRGALRYTCELSLVSSAGLATDAQSVFTVRPAFAWEIPRKLLHSKSHWVVGVGVPVSFGPDGSDVGLSAKFRGDFDFKRLIGRKK